MPKLPVVEVVRDSLALAFNGFGTVFRLTWLPFLVSALFSVLVQYLDSAISVHPAAGMLLVVLVEVVSSAAFAISVAALHRFVLFGDDNGGRLVPRPPGKVEVFYFAVGIAWNAALFVAFLATEALGAAGVAFGVIALVAFVVVGLRLSLLFPLIAVEHRFDLPAAWSLTQGNALRLLGVFAMLFALLLLGALAFFAVFTFGAMLLNFFPPSWRVAAALIGGGAVVWIVTTAVTAMFVGSVAFSYKYIRGVAANDVIVPAATGATL